MGRKLVASAMPARGRRIEATMNPEEQSRKVAQQIWLSIKDKVEVKPGIESTAIVKRIQDALILFWVTRGLVIREIDERHNP